MTVKELIEELQKLNPDAMVVIDGYYNNYDEMTEIEPMKIKLNAGAK